MMVFDDNLLWLLRKTPGFTFKSYKIFPDASYKVLFDAYRLVEDDIDIPSVALEVLRDLPDAIRDFMLTWSDSVLSDP
ncbi:hypothetical protein J5N97_002002 [Dioscorea zingiberensis]|uniref:Uncharacterized protein n=1 Tax=Dioscorea zingiberensis TaxID=325984 RepID=A0A9D5BVK4_9LILI|nr:hypothetical protein J5N97_002002 [Dioscorea zingiberensis]